jgi:hypothetical protein
MKVFGRWFSLAVLLVTPHLQAQGARTATAMATIFNGFVVGVTVTDGGAGYGCQPTVTFSGSGGMGAGAYSVVSNGAVIQIVVTNAGSGYATDPAVAVSAPTGAFSFRSTSAYIEVPDSPSLDSTTDQLTVECWFNRQAAQGDWNSLISKSSGSSTPDGYELRFSPNKPVGTIMVDPSYPIGDLPGSSQPTYPAWHHYAWQFDGAALSLWLDGQMIAATNATGQIDANANGLTIGAEAPGFRAFNGYVAEVRISSVARYRSAFTPQMRFSSDSNTVALYHLDEGCGSTAYDASGNGNDGTIYGSSAWSTNIIPSPPLVGIRKAVYVDFSGLAPGTSYQLQTSSNLLTGPWSNYGAPFTATNSTMTYPAYWRVSDWNQLYFRLLP